MISFPTGETASDISTISYGSFVLTDNGNVYGFGQCCDQSKSHIVQKLDLNNVSDGSLRKLFVSEEHYFGSFIEEKVSILPLNNFKALEKLFLNKIRQILKKVIEPICDESNHSKQFLML